MRQPPPSRHPSSTLHSALLEWFGTHARDLPWRGAGARAWPVLVSEVMLQQTPVARVRPVFESWLRRWPGLPDLAADSPGEAVRGWGRLGYPRRALRLHQAAVVCVDRHGGDVPRDIEALRALPGVGEYTAAAVASFAFGDGHVLLDTNVRRVLARLVGGRELPPTGATTAPERSRAAELLPGPPLVAASWNAAVMELGALVCTARSPDCARCPVATRCAWRLAGSPRSLGPLQQAVFTAFVTMAGGAAQKVQGYAGTDRQVRGRLLAVLREADGPVGAAAMEAAWAQTEQRTRALDGLVADGLVQALGDATYRFPG